MVKATVSLAAKIGKGLATPAAPSTNSAGKAKDFFREASMYGFKPLSDCHVPAPLHECCRSSSGLAVQVCRIAPWTVTNYKLDELITARDLRRNIAEQFQKHAKVNNPAVMLPKLLLLTSKSRLSPRHDLPAYGFYRL